MASHAPNYPFTPKSTRFLKPGDFWAVPLQHGRFACGRVLQTVGDRLPSSSRTFFGGLQHWVGPEPPTAEGLAGTGLVDVGVMHVKAILETGRTILGNRPLEADGIELPLLLDAQWGPGTSIVRGAQIVRRARPDEWGKLPVLSTWGFGVIRVLAEKTFAIH